LAHGEIRRHCHGKQNQQPQRSSMNLSTHSGSSNVQENGVNSTGSNRFLLRKKVVGGIVAFRSAKAATNFRQFRGAKGDSKLSATDTY
jgi:hypothetical protein